MEKLAHFREGSIVYLLLHLITGATFDDQVGWLLVETHHISGNLHRRNGSVGRWCKVNINFRPIIRTSASLFLRMPVPVSVTFASVANQA